MSSDMNVLQEILKSELVLMSVSFSDKQVEQLLIYVDELIRWNKVYNLTSVREPKDILYKHILDSLSVLGLLDGSQRILDVGAGAGLPGIPLAVLRPELSFTTLDSNNKKTRFMINVIGKLSLQNVEVIHSRVEKYQPENQYDLVISRAYASLEDFVSGTKHLCAGRWLAMKGRHAVTATEMLDADFVRTVHQLVVPSQLGERHVVEIKSIIN